MSTNFKVGELYQCISHAANLYTTNRTLDEHDTRVLLASPDGVQAFYGISNHCNILSVPAGEPMLILDWFNLADISMRQCQKLASKLGISDPNESPTDLAKRALLEGRGRAVWVKVLANEMVLWHWVIICDVQRYTPNYPNIAYCNMLRDETIWARR